MQTNREARIRERAHKIWQDEGHADGKHDEHWHRATAEIDAEDKAATSKGTKRATAKNGAKSDEAATAAKPDRSHAKLADTAPTPAKKAAAGKSSTSSAATPRSRSRSTVGSRVS